MRSFVGPREFPLFFREASPEERKCPEVPRTVKYPARMRSHMGDQAIHGLPYTQVLKRAVPRLQRIRGISPRLDVCDLLLRGRKLMNNR